MRGDNVRVTHGAMEGGSRAEQQQINRQAEQSASTDLLPFQTRTLVAFCLQNHKWNFRSFLGGVHLLKNLIKMNDQVPIC